jgi:transposase InsO family protein
VNRKNYYSFLKQKERTDDNELIDFIVTTQRKHHFGIGYRTMTNLIRNYFGETVSQKKVLRLMEENDVLSVVRRKRYRPDVYEKMKETLKNIPENMLQRNFSASEPNKVYVSDITYLYGRERIMYLSIIVDLYNKEIVAWQISEHPDKELCIETLNILASKRDLRNTVIHTDQGSTYLSLDFRNKVLELGMIQSCSARGECWDNAAMESVNGIIKTECLYNRFKKSKFKNRQIPIADVLAEVIPFISYYNNERPKSELGGLSPVQYRLQKSMTLRPDLKAKILVPAAVF